jgi:hypothetical protein
VVCRTRLAGDGGFSRDAGAGERRDSAIDGDCATLDSIQHESDDDAGADAGEWDDDYAY